MKYSDLLNIIDFNQNEPWNYDFYTASVDGETTDQQFADNICEAIPGLPCIPFYIIRSQVYFVLPVGTVIPEGMLNNIVPITEVPTEADILAARAAAEAAYQAELAAQVEETPPE